MASISPRLHFVTLALDEAAEAGEGGGASEQQQTYYVDLIFKDRDGFFSIYEVVQCCGEVMAAKLFTTGSS